MTIYLRKTDAGNDVVFYQNGMAKMNDFWSSDYRLDGVIDLYGDNTEEELKKYFSKNADNLNDFFNMPGDEIEFNPDEANDKLIAVFSD